jgi:hypothetical protein
LAACFLSPLLPLELLGGDISGIDGIDGALEGGEGIDGGDELGDGMEGGLGRDGDDGELDGGLGNDGGLGIPLGGVGGGGLEPQLCSSRMPIVPINMPIKVMIAFRVTCASDVRAI